MIFLKISFISVATGVSSGRSWQLGWKSCLLALTLPALMFLSAPTSSAQVQPETPELAGIAHAAIRVSDLNRSRDFYESLGFEEAFAMNQGETATEAFLKINDRQFIELYPKREPSEPVGFMHVCFESTDLEGLNRFYLSHGLSPIPVRRARAGNLLFTMQGPERQNIEYTQYMPGSKHSNDRGMHLGANRISNEIVAVGIEMQYTAAAQTFYEKELAFKRNLDFDPRQIWLDLPGQSGQLLEIIQHTPGSAFQLFFGISDLQRTAKQLEALHLKIEKRKNTLSISDPDGNRLVFIKDIGTSARFEQNLTPLPLGKQ
jgi:catechol 2,3-dioxygenase-like lactoylglutathione lyase family enzyme